MKFKSGYLLVAILFALISCSNGQNKTRLSAVEFNEAINKSTNVVILDVRTPGEFSSGHLANALNIDWNNESSEAELKKLDPSKEYFVYCLSGGRSASAAEYLRANGFKKVYELNGGIMKWRAAGLAESNTTASSTSAANVGMSMSDYQKLLQSDKPVVIDIYAEWCGPCKKMSPYLTEMQNTMSNKVTIIRIDADKNTALCKELKVDALPTIYVYKNNTKTFEHIGFLSKDDLLKKL
jgi:thioredoxin 1